jgi:hypothetical protein
MLFKEIRQRSHVALNKEVRVFSQSAVPESVRAEAGVKKCLAAIILLSMKCA